MAKFLADWSLSWSSLFFFFGLILIGNGLAEPWLKTLVHDLAFTVWGIGIGVDLQRHAAAPTN